MSLVQHAEPGGEYLIPWAKNKFRFWHEEMLRTGVNFITRVVYASDSSIIRVHSLHLGFGVFQDWLRITAGGDYVIGDPYQPLWNIQSALMPGTRAGVVPALAWTPSVQHITSYYPDSTGSYLRRHWLVICRYCKRVAEYTWDEVGTNTEVSPATDPKTYGVVITGKYVSHATNGSSVTLVDVDIAGVSGTPYTVTISPSLVAASETNAWGWIESGTVTREVSGPTIATTYVSVDEGLDENGNHIWLHTSTTKFTVQYVDDASIASQSSITGTQHLQTYFDGTHGPPNGFIDAETIYTGEFVGVGASYITTAGTYWNDDVVSTTPTTSHALYLSEVAWAAATNAAYDLSVVAAVKGIVSAVLSAMNAKKFGSPEVAELRPYDNAIDHRKIGQALAIPAYSAAQYTFSRNAASDTLAYNSIVLASLIPSSIYGVSISLSSPAVPAAPSTPWAITVNAPLVFTYAPATKTFVAAGTLPLLRAHYSKGVVSPLSFGQTVSLGYNGFYKIRGNVLDDGGDAAPIYTLGEFDLPTAAELASLMQRLCVGDVTRVELAKMVYYSAVGADPALVTYRAIDHIHVNGSYSFTQPAIV